MVTMVGLYKYKNTFLYNRIEQSHKLYPGGPSIAYNCTEHVYYVLFYSGMPEPVGAGVFGWSRSRNVHPDPAPTLQYFKYFVFTGTKYDYDYDDYDQDNDNENNDDYDYEDYDYD